MVSFTGPKTRARLTQLLLVWWYGKESLKRYKPLVRAEFAEGDMIAEARMLNGAGYHVAAAATARAMLEKKLRKATVLANGGYTGKDSLKSKSADQLNDMLSKRGVWSIEDRNRFKKNYNKLTGYLHCNPVERRLVADAIYHAEVLAAKLDSLILFGMGN